MVDFGGMGSWVGFWGWIPGDGFQGMESTGEFCEVDSVGMDCKGWILGGGFQGMESAR